MLPYVLNKYTKGDNLCAIPFLPSWLMKPLSNAVNINFIGENLLLDRTLDKKMYLMMIFIISYHNHML